MLYRIFRVIVRFALKIFFRHIHLEGLQNLKPGKAQILASNHPAGFLEPLIMACFFPRSLYFLVRGDIFENKFLRPILLGTHQIPIFRFKDGFSKLRENKQSMQEATSVLLDKKCILIFVEGSTKSVKMLRPLQKGFVRLALDAKTIAPEQEIEIVPVGINFSDSSKFRSDVMIRVGQPVLAENMDADTDLSLQTKHVNELIAKTYSGMKEQIIHMADMDRLRFMEKMFLLNDVKNLKSAFSAVLYSDKHLLEYKDIATKVESLTDDEVKALRSEIQLYEASLKRQNIILQDLGKKSPKWYHYILLIFGFLPAVAGLVIHSLPLLVSYIFTKTNIKSKEFYGAIWFVMNIVTLIVFYLIGFFLMIFDIIPLVVYATSPVLGYFARWYYDLLDGFYWNIPKKTDALRKKANDILEKFHKSEPLQLN